MLRVLILLFARVVTVSPVHGKSAEPGWGVGYGTPSEAKSISLDADAGTLIAPRAFLTLAIACSIA